ncbi:ATP-binding protein [Desulfuribacillus alkaliarsenatis]|uniref:histidine kinase n=1 Tax=Desulfuribacillus alkaliarsenatis TaxID=766136 RepID=A0A1E5G484_9FIRM|nr:sensor histidine kinase [Desulfuribacillus alkaliarsenatis]OEF97902.1 histidine kinase [Desulfuribacillus alkaliarsenatis]
MEYYNKPITLRTKITILVFGLVFVSSLLGALLLVENVQRSVEVELGERVMAIAKTVAQMDELKENISDPEGWKKIQPIAERVRLATNIEYIVVLNMDRIRYSSPLEDRIGTRFSGGDEGPAFAEHEYISPAKGVLGPSVRAFVPIMDESQQLGVVVAGVLTPTYTSLIQKYRIDIYLSLIGALVLGFIGSWLLASNVKRQLFNMEPIEIARQLKERSAVFHTIKEGIIAVDRDGKVSLANEQAKNIFNFSTNIIGECFQHLLPDSPVYNVMDTGSIELNKNMLINNKVYITSFMPIKVNEQILGAVITLQEQSEAYLIAEELTGVKKFIEALRVQNHEHMNKLHTIAGLLQLQQYDKALDYVFTITEEHQALTGFLTKNFTDYSISGLLLGKYSRGKELGIEIMIDPKSTLKSLPEGIGASTFVIIIGNLLENAMDAVTCNPIGQRSIYIHIYETKEDINIVVRDNGSGIKDSIKSRIFEQGFTTKTTSNHGIGLALVKEYIEAANGTIHFETEISEGSTFFVVIPKHRF